MFKEIDRWLYKKWARWERYRRGILNPVDVLLLDIVLALISWFVFLFWLPDVAYIILLCAHLMMMVSTISFRDPDGG
jgi:hypothetical protein